MSKNILIIGGSYFIGRVCALMLLNDKTYSVSILNRGNNPLKKDGIKEYKSDRHDLKALKSTIPDIAYDAVIDFCAYSPKDIDSLINNIPGQIKQYIYISSCTVYETSFDYPKYEFSPKISRMGLGPAGEYAYNKLLLEKEAENICVKKKIPYTILRPAFVYGPYNYAPRESFFFKLILSKGIVPIPQNLLTLFQLVYVEDIGRIIQGCIGNKKVYNNSYNLSSPELLSYDKLLMIFNSFSDSPIKTQPYSSDTILKEHIPLPFPIEQHELFSGKLIADTLKLEYTTIDKGMKESYNFYKKYVYKP